MEENHFISTRGKPAGLPASAAPSVLNMILVVTTRVTCGASQRSHGRHPTPRFAKQPRKDSPGDA